MGGCSLPLELRHLLKGLRLRCVVDWMDEDKLYYFRDWCNICWGVPVSEQPVCAHTVTEEETAAILRAGVYAGLMRRGGAYGGQRCSMLSTSRARREQ